MPLKCFVYISYPSKDNMTFIRITIPLVPNLYVKNVGTLASVLSQGRRTMNGCFPLNALLAAYTVLPVWRRRVCCVCYTAYSLNMEVPLPDFFCCSSFVVVAAVFASPACGGMCPHSVHMCFVASMTVIFENIVFSVCLF